MRPQEAWWRTLSILWLLSTIQIEDDTDASAHPSLGNCGEHRAAQEMQVMIHFDRCHPEYFGEDGRGITTRSKRFCPTANFNRLWTAGRECTSYTQAGAALITDMEQLSSSKVLSREPSQCALSAESQVLHGKNRGLLESARVFVVVA